MGKFIVLFKRIDIGRDSWIIEFIFVFCIGLVLGLYILV